MPVSTVCAYRLVKSMSIPKQTKNIRSSMLTKINKIYAPTSACFCYVVASASKLNQQWHRCLKPVMASNNDANANKDTFLK